MKQTSFLELDGISLRVEDRIIFRDCHWSFDSDQQWGLIGVNGSGKTLLARAIAGETPIASGEIQCHFHHPKTKLPEDCITFVSFEKQKAAAGEGPTAVRWFSLEQESALLAADFLSYENVEEINPFEVRPGIRRERALFLKHQRRICRLLQIRNLLDRSLPSLSNGEMRKILLARALLKKPKLLILEDVFSGLDSEYREHLKAILERLMQHGSVRFLLITARPNELPENITHLLCVHRCRIIAYGPKRQILANSRVQRLFFNTNAAFRAPLRRHFRTSIHPEELVRMKNVSIRYNDKQILDCVNWTIRRGESWALLGPNGAGKSTLISLINGDNPQAYANSIYLFGRRRGSGESIWDLKKRIGLMSSELHLHFTEPQTCLDAIISGFRDSIAGAKRATARQHAAAKRILGKFGLTAVAQHPFESLSMGAQRMALLARALVKSPELLLLDEPCQGLDAAHRAIFLQILESLLQRKDTTIIYVTHLYEEIPKGIRNVIRLRNGRIVKQRKFTKPITG
jgi:molybdate transport system ATP-binding protein